MEIWKDIPDYEGKYQVSDMGRVKSLRDKYGNYREKLLKLAKRKDNYLYVNLCKNGKGKTCLVHRLVAEAFIDKIEGKDFVDHIDGNRQNNNVNNLRWCSQAENNQFDLCRKHMSKARKGKYTGEKHPMYGKHHTEEIKRKISEANSKKVLCVEMNKIYGSATEAGRELGIDSSHISACCNGKKYKSAGKHPVTGEKLHWKYIELLPCYN